MKEVKTMPTANLGEVLRLLVNLGVHAEEFAVSDSYIYRDMGKAGYTIPLTDATIGQERVPLPPEKFKMDGEKSFIHTVSDIRSRNSNVTTNHWSIGVDEELSPMKFGVASCNNFYIFRVNKEFLKEIIADLKEGNRRNYSLGIRIVKSTKRKISKGEASYDKYRIATLEKLQYVIKREAPAIMLEEQARKLHECGLVAI